MSYFRWKMIEYGSVGRMANKVGGSSRFGPLTFMVLAPLGELHPKEGVFNVVILDGETPFDARIYGPGDIGPVVVGDGDIEWIDE